MEHHIEEIYKILEQQNEKLELLQNIIISHDKLLNNFNERLYILEQERTRR